MLIRRFLTLLVFSGMALGCRTTEPAASLQLAASPVAFSIMGDSLPADPAIESLIQPYRNQLEEGISEVIGEAGGLLEKGSPESGLGNMAADAMLQVANRVSEQPVHMSLTNNGGLRVSIAPGPITVGEIFELMPFDNLMVVLDLTGHEVDSLAQQIAALNGEPIAGFSFSFDEETRSASDIRVAGEPLGLDNTYRLVTSDYLANGGGRVPALWSPQKREDLNVFLRDAFIEYIRFKNGKIEPILDGRILINSQ